MQGAVMLSRDMAWDLVREWTDSERLRIHATAVEAVMRDFARLHGQDENLYGLTGLLHDADYDRWPSEHPARVVAWLLERGEAEMAHAIKAHCPDSSDLRDSLLSKALVASDEITGFVMACALVRPERTAGLTPKSVQKKLKTPAFAAGVNRDEVSGGFALIAEAIGGSADEHIQRVIDALHLHRKELGLLPPMGE
jgi:predicted hydrolase (HD superfamily)